MDEKITFEKAMEELEKIIGYNFKDKSLLNVALTHSSFAHKFNQKNNERLEFLGDSILGFIIAEFLVKNIGDDDGYTVRRQNSKFKR